MQLYDLRDKEKDIVFFAKMARINSKQNHRKWETMVFVVGYEKLSRNHNTRMWFLYSCVYWRLNLFLRWYLL